MIRVRVAPVLVVRRDDLRTELADQLHQRRCGVFHLQRGEAAVRQRRQRVALGETRVDPAEPLLPDAEDLAGRVHLLPADLGDVREHVRAVHVRIQDRAALTTGTGGDHHVDAFGDVPGGRRGALAGLVVGVSMDMQQAKIFSHKTQWSSKPEENQ